jgi:hypothetical protein
LVLYNHYCKKCHKPFTSSKKKEKYCSKCYEERGFRSYRISKWGTAWFSAFATLLAVAVFFLFCFSLRAAFYFLSFVAYLVFVPVWLSGYVYVLHWFGNWLYLRRMANRVKASFDIVRILKNEFFVIGLLGFFNALTGFAVLFGAPITILFALMGNMGLLVNGIVLTIATAVLSARRKK